MANEINVENPYNYLDLSSEEDTEFDTQAAFFKPVREGFARNLLAALKSSNPLRMLKLLHMSLKGRGKLSMALTIVQSEETLASLVACLSSESSTEEVIIIAVKNFGYLWRFTSGDELIAAGAFTALIKMLDSKVKNILLAVLVTLDNSISEMSERGLGSLLEAGILPSLVKLIMTAELHHEDDNLLKPAADILETFTSDKEKSNALPMSDFNSLLPAITFLLGRTEENILSTAFEILAFFENLRKLPTKEILKSGILSKVVSLMGNDKFELRRLAVRTVFRIFINRDPLDIKILMSAGALEKLAFAFANSSTIKDRIRCIIILDKVLQLGCVTPNKLREAGLFPLLIQEVNKADPETDQSSAKVLIFAVLHKALKNAGFANYLVEQGVVQCLTGILKRRNLQFLFELGERALAAVVLSSKDEFKTTALSILSDDNEIRGNDAVINIMFQASCQPED